MLHSLRGYRVNGQTFVDRKRSGYLSSPANLPLRTVGPMMRSDAKTISIEIIVDRNSVKIGVSALSGRSPPAGYRQAHRFLSVAYCSSVSLRNIPPLPISIP